MPTMRQRRQFRAQICTPRGRLLTEAFVIADVERTVQAGAATVQWSGRLSSLSDPAHALGGLHLLQAVDGGAAVRIEVQPGPGGRMGLTSDEYVFRGVDVPPEAP